MAAGAHGRRPARVLMTADPIGGVWTYALTLAEALGRERVEVGLATLGRSLTLEERQRVVRLPDVELFESDFRLEWMDAAWKDVAASRDWLLGLEERLGPDVVHLNGFCHGDLSWSVPALIAGHSCVLSWWQAVHGEPAPPAWQTYRERVEAGLRGASLVVAPTAAMLAALEFWYGPLGRTRVIANGCRPERLEAKPDCPIVLSAGRLWDEAKNLRALDAAAAGLPWTVCVAGDDRGPGGRCTDARHVRLLGPLSPPELARWMARAAIYALPARYEPFGLSALEAACAGCALVLGDIPSLREIWDGAALFVPPDDPGALAATLRGLIADPARRRRLAARAARRAGRFTVDRMVAGYLEAYAACRDRLDPAEARGGRRQPAHVERARLEPPPGNPAAGYGGDRCAS